MNILQLANDYFNSDLYSTLFDHLLKEDIRNQVYIPVSRGQNQKSNLDSDFFVDPCFSTVDRILFYTKQNHMEKNLEQWADFSKIDVIHAHTLFSTGYTAWKLSQKFGVPYIAAVRNTDKNVFFKYMLHLRSAGVKIMRDAQYVVFLSPSYRDRVIETYVPASLRETILAKSLIIPNGIDDYYLENQPEPRNSVPETIRLIYVGEINSNKNLETTIAAAELLKNEGITVQLTVVGDILETKYQELMNRTPFVIYHPRSPKEQVLQYLRQSDIFIMPSHAETFGLVYGEAMSQGIPVLYTREQGFDGQFGEGQAGFAVSDSSPQDIAEKIHTVLADYTAISSRCVTLAHKFDWKAIAKQYRDIYIKIKKDREIV